MNLEDIRTDILLDGMEVAALFQMDKHTWRAAVMEGSTIYAFASAASPVNALYHAYRNALRGIPEYPPRKKAETIEDLL